MMNKQEFIERLTTALKGRIPAVQVEDNVQYYQDYINAQIRNGKSEAEVMDALGDPRLIARTIIETTQPAGGNQGKYTTAEGYGRDSYQNNAQGTYTHYKDNRKESNYKAFRIPGWLLTILVILVVFLIFSLVFHVLTFLAPVIIVIVAVVFLVKLFRDWLN